MKTFTCIICPNGCSLSVDDNLNVTGNTCKRGLEFAIQEINDPKRSITSTVKTSFKEIPVMPVKSDGPIKKDLILDCIKEINKVLIKDKLEIGSVVLKNILNTGVNIILTSNKLKEIN